MKTSKCDVFIVWMLDADNARYEPVTAFSDYDEAMEYVYEREEDYDCTYIVTSAKITRPTEGLEEELEHASNL